MGKVVRYVFFLVIILSLVLIPACGGSGEPALTPSPSPTATPTTPATPATPSTPAPSPVGNQPPVIQSLAPQAEVLGPGDETTVNCSATDPDGDTLTYNWSATSGTFTTQSSGSNWAKWQAGEITGTFEITVNVADSNGNSVSQSVNITVTDNLPPVISSVTAVPAVLYQEQNSTINCEAADPEGGNLVYTWRADSGSISGTGKSVTWKSPAADGEYEITVSVADGKGGVTQGSVKIGVQNPESSQTFFPVVGEGGCVDANGIVLTNVFRVGDDDNNVGIRSYFSFDITSLDDYEIKEAIIQFAVKETVGDPWSFIPPFMYVQQVSYGERALVPTDYHNLSTTGAVLIESKYEPPEKATVTYKLNQMIIAKETRYQVRVSMSESGQNNYNKAADYIEFAEAKLIVTYVSK